MASKALETNVIIDPATALLNLKPAELSHNQFRLLIQLTTAAKQTIAKAWKTQTLVVAEAKHRMNKALIFGKMTAIETNKVMKFKKVWNPWVKHHLPPDFDESLFMPW